MTRWTVRLEQLSCGNWFLRIPDEVMQLAKMKPGDSVEVSVTPSGAMVLARTVVVTTE
jgi:antitoxin component of MazEF toxin-antitoxin module